MGLLFLVGRTHPFEVRRTADKARLETDRKTLSLNYVARLSYWDEYTTATAVLLLTHFVEMTSRYPLQYCFGSCFFDQKGSCSERNTSYYSIAMVGLHTVFLHALTLNITRFCKSKCTWITWLGSQVKCSISLRGTFLRTFVDFSYNIYTTVDIKIIRWCLCPCHETNPLETLLRLTGPFTPLRPDESVIFS